MPRLNVPTMIALVLALALAAAGCSNMPTQPLESSTAQTASNTNEESAQTLSLLGGSSTTTTRTATIGILGGTVSAGDFTVLFPPGALTQQATVTVSQPDLAHPVVNLSISPPSANKFLVPVLLTANASRLDRNLISTACISYYNPATGKWENLASTVNVLSLRISTPLWHFSTYRVTSGGKAGW
ncbi:MAG TPA: hypothetical protein VFD83_04305 [Candidatus Polarisedimenticolia bacterium]|nr:hypothetical protein [Candidatus Polarisedimenticolia bacterium]